MADEDVARCSRNLLISSRHTAARRIAIFLIFVGISQGVAIIAGFITRDFKVDQSPPTALVSDPIGFPLVGFWVCVGTMFASAWLRRRNDRQGQSTGRAAAILIAVLVLGGPAFYLSYKTSFDIWWQQQDVMSRYLLERTPVGATRRAVEQDLSRRGIQHWEASEAVRLEWLSAVKNWRDTTKNGTRRMQVPYPMPPEPAPLVIEALHDEHGRGWFHRRVFGRYEFDLQNRLTGISVRAVSDACCL